MKVVLAALLFATLASSCLSDEAKRPSNIHLAVDVNGDVTINVPSADGTSVVMLKGQSTQGGLMIGTAKPGIRLTFDGQSVMVGEGGEFVIGFDRDAPKLMTLGIDAPTEENRARTDVPIPVIPRAWNIQKIDGLPPEQVNPTAEELVRIKKEAVEKREARKADTPGAWFAEKFIWPAQGPVSGVFGSQRILNGEPRAPHYGVDMAVPDGTPVKAPAGGIVRLAAKDFYFEGGLVFIDHGHGLTSYIMHMSRVDVRVGQELKQGDVIGASGHSGRATGPHVHWGMFWLAAHIDPQLLVPPAPGAPAAPELAADAPHKE